MKATGIVRRIDDLGRVIIPKEIRRTLRMREGDPLEIFVDNDELILKKYSSIRNLSDFAKDLVQSLHDSIDCIICVTDTDSIVAIAGASKSVFIGKRISEYVSNMIKNRSVVVSSESQDVICSITADESFPRYANGIIAPIISQGDSIGAIIILSSDNNRKMGELEIKLAETMASYLGKQVEL